MPAHRAAQQAADSAHIYQVKATRRGTGDQVTLAYRIVGEAGHGSFGVVLKAELLQGGGTDVVAIKRVKQDERSKNRELQIMSAVAHPHIVKLQAFWFEASLSGEDAVETWLHLVFELIPKTLHHLSRSYSRRNEYVPELLVKLWVYQLLRALSYLHSIGVCHRDIKPHNLMCDPASGRLVLIDFGSAKVLGEANVSYTCSRFYRAPELVLGASLYADSIDLWSSGCVLAELLAGKTFFVGQDGVGQLVEIIKVLGTPTRREVLAMQPTYVEHDFAIASPEALDLLASILVYTPSFRPRAIEAMCHPFFDELRLGNTRSSSANGTSGSGRQGRRWGLVMPDSQAVTVPPFDFSTHELSICPDLNPILVPSHARAALLAGPDGIDLDRFKPIDLAPLRLSLD
ncbi:uncharacterized protein RHOBADRAFT_44122 [Rhodotorula graminis WP1]|uniref:Protein kinase domain-containing protein n=1 Tax=Rhodotorula graminis (strain WP1) TaxID=578459 RepID=A0A194S5B4_RHOGW|nr:uncharacterized protein RHOBADRAFT_44122 [Rhodotorula graminis WP1]KPV74606.1 hypothetical protein RHOBADRAFT_44122 [Rhodotorula graminis WP1]